MTAKWIIAIAGVVQAAALFVACVNIWRANRILDRHLNRDGAPWHYDSAGNWMPDQSQEAAS